MHNINVMSEWTSLYRQAGAEYGTSATQQLVLLRDGWVADSLEEVERVWWPCIRAADCIAAIQRFRDALGMDYLIMSFRMAAGPAHEQELACIRRFGRDVIPAFR